MSLPQPLARLPTWMSRWLGYRVGKIPKREEWEVWIWSWIGAFCGISVLQAVFGHARYFVNQNVPSIIPSFVSVTGSRLFLVTYKLC